MASGLRGLNGGFSGGHDAVPELPGGYDPSGLKQMPGELGA